MNETPTEPRIEFLMLADRAEAINGKLYIMGGAWDRITILDRAQPTAMSLALSISVPWHAANRPYIVQIIIEDGDGHPLMQTEASFTVGRPPHAVPGQPFRTLLAVPSALVQFPKYGAYLIRATIPGGD